MGAQVQRHATSPSPGLIPGWFVRAGIWLCIAICWQPCARVPQQTHLRQIRIYGGVVFNLRWKLKCKGGSIYIHESHSFLNSLSRQELSIWNGLIGGTHFFKLCQGRWATEGSPRQEAAGNVSWAPVQMRRAKNNIVLTQEWTSSFCLGQPLSEAEMAEPWQPAYLAGSNEKCVPVCQLVAVKWSLFHIYWGLVSHNTSYKTEKKRQHPPAWWACSGNDEDISCFYYFILCQDWFNFQVTCAIYFSESEKVKGGWMPPGHRRTNSPEWRLYRAYKPAPCKFENRKGLKVQERLNAQDSLRDWLIIR